MIFLKFDNRAVVKESLKSAAQIERLILTSGFLQKLSYWLPFLTSPRNGVSSDEKLETFFIAGNI